MSGTEEKYGYAEEILPDSEPEKLGTDAENTHSAYYNTDGAENGDGAENTDSADNPDIPKTAGGGYNSGGAEADGGDYGWVEKLRYSKSFTAKLALSDPKIKEYYAMLATELLSYSRVRSHIGWAGITFSAGREQVAKFAISGKTLCLYLAADPEEMTGAKYRATAAGAKKYDKTPALLRIKSDGAARNAVRMIAAAMAAHGIEKRDTPSEPVLSSHFPTDSFHNLLTRGLIRLLKVDRRGSAAWGGNNATGDAQTAENTDGEIAEEIRRGIYEDTVSTMSDLLSRHGGYDEILTALSGGEAEVRVSERIMLRAIDEMWVRTVEDSIPALDFLIRHPTGYIAETEEVLPIEMTKKITGRSIMHLARHSDYLSKNDNDELMPTKLLNVFREDSLLTYENKFLNTLLSRLSYFVSRRYEIWEKRGADERVRRVDFTDKFIHGEAHGVIHMTIELSEKYEGEYTGKNTTFDSKLRERVRRLNDITSAYQGSEFVRKMGRNYIYPPVMRTNAIMKNKYFRQCLSLWEFIESYDDAGYGLTVDERIKDVSPEYVTALYSGAATQYLMFCHDVLDGEGIGEEIAGGKSQTLTARILDGTGDYSPDEDVRGVYEKREEADEDGILFAMETALLADEEYRREDAAPDGAQMPGDSFSVGGIRYYKSFLARLHTLDDEGKEYFTSVANILLGYKKVKMRVSRSFATFRRGRQLLARVTIRGRTVYLYLPLDPSAQEAKYHLRDVSDVIRLADTPALLRVRSARALKYADTLISAVCTERGVVTGSVFTALTPEDYPFMTLDELIAAGLVRKSGTADGAEADDMTEDDATAAKDAADIAGDYGYAEEIPVDGDTAEERAGREIAAAVSFIRPARTSPDTAEHTGEPAGTGSGGERVDMLPVGYRVNDNYDDPEMYGLDDPSGFIRDIDEYERGKTDAGGDGK